MQEIDERVLQLVEERTRFPRECVLRSLKRGRRNCYTVAYHLLNDSVQMLDRTEVDPPNREDASMDGTESVSEVSMMNGIAKSRMPRRT